MASEIDICNLALGHLADDAEVASISPPDGSAQASHCKRLYPIARDALLALHDWTFATGRETGLAEITSPSDGYAFAYTVPTGVIRPIKAMLEGEADETGEGVKFKVEEDKTILSNEPIGTLLVVRRIIDTNKFSPLFVTCLSWLLASYLAGPVLKEMSGSTAAAMAKKFEMELARASGNDANISNEKPIHKPGWIGAR